MRHREKWKESLPTQKTLVCIFYAYACFVCVCLCVRACAHTHVCVCVCEDLTIITLHGK